MKNDYLLTIAIPTYNGARTISNVLDILLPQCTEEVQLIISDNHSTDNTFEIVKKYINEYPDIEYIRNEKNIGPDSNFLQCMDFAEGKYTLLLSDDDILFEGKLKIILDFLRTNEDLSLVYLNAKGFHEHYENESKCEFYKGAIYDDKIFVTRNSQKFMTYAGRMWGFLSCFICLTEAYKSLPSMECYKGSNWLQSYIHILCSQYGEKKKGVIADPCIGAGIYSIVSNYDSGRVDGLSYKQMLNFAIKHGFDKKQLTNIFIWRVCFLFKRALIKERASGIIKSSIINVIKCTWMYPIVWIKLYPFFLIPPFLCKIIVSYNAKKKGYTKGVELNRSGDVIG